MAILPSASVSIDDESGAGASGANYAYVLGCVATSADNTPRVISSAKGFLDQYEYAQAADYIALHIEKTKKPVIFVGMPVATAGVLRYEDSSTVVGTSKISVAAAASGYLEEVDAILTVTTGGTVGSAGIVLKLSMDGGRTEKSIRLGTATSYTVPYLGIVISFGGGTLIAGDIYRFRTTAPMWDSTGLAAARDALAAQLKLGRSFVVIGDIPSSTFAGYVTTEANGYESENDRFVYARVNVADRLPLPTKSKAKVKMSGGPAVTFAEVGATGDTITRATGSFVTDGFVAGMLIDVSGSASNNFTNAKITGVTATVLTLDTQDLVAEVAAPNVAIVGSFELAFAEVGATGDTITRSGGSWIQEGFAVGDIVQVTGTASNNVTTDAIAALSATVMTLGSTDLTAESIASHKVTVIKVLSKTAYVSAMDTEFSGVDDQKRISIGLGRARKQSPITQWEFRRPVSWAASIREFGHELHIPTWRKEDGILDGWDLFDDDGNLYEHDERVDGGALAARFTCFRSYANGPRGAFIGLDMTRALDNSILSRTHNMAVANEACTIVHAETENAIGQSLVLKDDGTAEAASLSIIENGVNTPLKERLLKAGPEGQIASGATWRANTNDDLSVVPATLTGVLDLRENGTLEQIQTTVKVA